MESEMNITPDNATTIEELDGEAVSEELEEEPEVSPLDFEEELEAIVAELPELHPTHSEISENERYAELRSLGLTPREAYLATMPRERRSDNRSHLTGAIPKSSSAPHNQMSRQQMDMARSIFGDLDESEIRRLYKRVTK